MRSNHFLAALLIGCVGLTATIGVGPAAHGVLAGPERSAAGRTPTDLSLSGPPAHAGRTSTLVARLTTDSGRPLRGRLVLIDRWYDGRWHKVAEGRTSREGRLFRAMYLVKDPSENAFRARFRGTEALGPSGSGEVTVRLRQRRSVLRVSGPDRIVDETSVLLTVSHQTGMGEPVAGRVTLQRRYPGKAWRTQKTIWLGGDGRARVRVAPRWDSWWRITYPEKPWIRGGTSPTHGLDNVPPMAPVRLPSEAPRPRVGLPAQARAEGRGPNARVTRIPDRIWRDMTGRSWHSGCPVGRGGLRLIRINYWGFDGYRHRGELVVASGAVGKFVNAFSDLHAQRLPMRGIYRVDRFGWSEVLHGADDYKSMAADNTSAFNCRDVVGRPGVPSPHSYGRAVDVNPWENPYHSRDGWVPNSWWPPHSHRQVAWRSREHGVVRTFRSNGFTWTYGTDDSQHFDATSSTGRVVGTGCGLTVCH